jgi:RNA polymerase sigma-70 factor (ECF subfamily)
MQVNRARNNGTAQPAPTSWADLYEHNSARVRRYVQALVGEAGPASAEDLTHEVFLIAFSSWRKFRGSSTASTWLCGIAFNLARRHQLREAHASRALTELSASDLGMGPHPLPETIHLWREQEDALMNATLALPRTLRQAFVLHCLSGLSAQEAAAELGVSEGNLRVRVARARALVKERLGVSPDHSPLPKTSSS